MVKTRWVWISCDSSSPLRFVPVLRNDQSRAKHVQAAEQNKGCCLSAAAADSWLDSTDRARRMKTPRYNTFKWRLIWKVDCPRFPTLICSFPPHNPHFSVSSSLSYCTPWLFSSRLQRKITTNAQNYRNLTLCRRNGNQMKITLLKNTCDLTLVLRRD